MYKRQVAGYRKAWIEAQSYLNRLEEYESKSEEAKELGYAPSRDLELETLVGVLKGDILIQNHCYRGEEMAVMLDIAKEFSYKVTTFHHAIEAIKLPIYLQSKEFVLRCGLIGGDLSMKPSIWFGKMWRWWIKR